MPSVFGVTSVPSAPPRASRTRCARRLTLPCALLLLACGEPESTSPAPVDGGNADGSSASGGQAGGGAGGGGAGGAAGASGGVAGTSGAAGESGGAAGTPGGQGGEVAAGGSGGTPIETFCTLAECPEDVDNGLTDTPNTYRFENGGPYANVNLPAPAGAKCWCVVNERDDFTCTTDADCDQSTCDTGSGLCVKPGQHAHGPFDASIDPATADGTLQSNWGDHQGPNCPYYHLHGTFTSPANTGGVTDPPEADAHGGTCGHGGLVWLGDDGVILGP